LAAVSIGQKLVGVILIVPGIWLLTRTPRDRDVVPPGFTVVPYWEKWTGNEAEQMKSVVQDFNRTVGQEKHIYVEYLSMSTVDRKTLVATAAGVPPDVAGLWDAQVVQYADLNLLQPMDQMAASRGITADTYKKVFWDTCFYKEHLWALVSTPAAVALHWDKKVFWEHADQLRQAGCDPMRAPETIAELDKYSTALTERDPDHPSRLLLTGYLPNDTWYMNDYPYWFGGTVFDNKMQRCCLTDPPCVAAFTWFENTFQRLGADAADQFKSGFGQFNSTQNPFLIHKVAMEQQGPWMANYIYNLSPEMSEVILPKAMERLLPPVVRDFNYEWAVAPFPSAVPGLKDVTSCGADVLTIPRGAKHPAEAFEFIAYVQRQDVMEHLCSLHCKPSPLSKVSEKFVQDHPNPYIDIFERLERSPNAHPVLQTPVLTEMRDELTAMTDRMALLQGSPMEGLEQSKKRIDAMVAAYEDREHARELAEMTR
jgi:multiple sugar transport system substrate-binding protein